MKRLMILALLGVGVVVMLRKMAESGGPSLGERCSEMCDRMLDAMPESFPPNRMMADLDELKERTARILELLEKKQS